MMSFSLIIAVRQKFTRLNKKQYTVCIKVCHKTKVYRNLMISGSAQEANA